MEIYAIKFMEKYKKDYDFDFNDETDRLEFIKTMNELEAFECATFFKEEGLSNKDFENFKKTAIKICKGFIKVAQDKEKLEEFVKAKDKEVLKISNKELNLLYYQKLVAVFNELDYDHLSDREKLELIDKIYEDKFLTKERISELDLNNEEYLRIKRDILTKLTSLVKNNYTYTLEDKMGKYINLHNKSEKELLDLLKELDNIKNDDLEIENLNTKDFNNVKEILKESILNELSNQLVFKDISKISSLDKFTKDLETLIDYYDINKDDKEKLKAKIKKIIEKEKEKRNKNNYFNIGDSVVLTSDVEYYDDEKGFFEGFKNNDDKKIYVDDKFVKKNTIGKIGGYLFLLEKDNKNKYAVLEIKESIKEDPKITTKKITEAFNNYINKGYKVIGYRFDYKEKNKNKSTYVKTEDVKSKKLGVNNNIDNKNKKSFKVLAKKHLKKAIIGVAALATVAIAGTSLYNHVKDKALSKNQEKPTIENTVNNNISNITNSENNTNDINNTNKDDTNQSEEEKLGKEIRSILASMPDKDSEFNIDKDAKIYENKNYKNGKTSYFNTHKDYDLKRNTDGYVLKDNEGKRKVISDIDEAINLIIDGKYSYIGVRALNEYSKTDTDYEGFYKADDLIIDKDNSLLDDYTKTLKR